MAKRRGHTWLAVTLVAALPAVFATAASAAPGGTPGPSPNAPGQANKVAHAPSVAAHAAKPAHPTHPAKPSHSAAPSHVAPSHPSHPAHPATPARPSSKPSKAAPHVTPASPHAKAGKETICHATGSATNPYVEITISKNAIPAHTRHQDGRDIVPAPADGCPGAAPQAVQSTTPSAVTNNAPAAAPAAAPASTVAAALRHSALQRTRSHGSVHVLGERAVGGPSRTAARVRALAESMRGSLPFTGLQLFGVFALGALLLGSGLAVRSRT